MDFVKNDFEYYERTIKIMYNKYYNKRLILAVVALVVIVAYTAIMQTTIVVNVILIAILVALIIYLTTQRQKFAEVYAAALAQNTPTAKIEKLQEDEYSYRVLDTDNLRINKNGVRNLPSSNKKYTLMAGFSKVFFSKQPLHVLYYDMLDITYEEKYRLSRNGYSKTPRFLRRFSPQNLKASAGNAFSFIFGNIFMLFIFYRVIRYIIAMVMSMMR